MHNRTIKQGTTKSLYNVQKYSICDTKNTDNNNHLLNQHHCNDNDGGRDNAHCSSNNNHNDNVIPNAEPDLKNVSCATNPRAVTTLPLENVLDQFIGGDTLSTLPTLPSNCVDIVICSAPLKYTGNTSNNVDNNWSSQEYISNTIQVFQQLDRILKPRAAVCWYQNYPLHCPSFPFQVCTSIERDTPFTLYDVIYWKRSNPFPVASSSYALTKTIEMIFIFGRKNAGVHGIYTNKRVTHRRYDTKQKIYNVWYSYLEADGDDNGNHNNSTFPVDLCRKLMDMYCPAQGVALDLFSVSDTLALAAKESARYFIGLGLEKKFIALANSHLQSYCDSLPKPQPVIKPTRNASNNRKRKVNNNTINSINNTTPLSPAKRQTRSTSLLGISVGGALSHNNPSKY